MTHVIQFSGGVCSFFAAKRVVDKYGKDDVVLLFADTLIEDEDLYRFLDDTSNFLGVPVTRIADGRNPWEVFKDERMIGNSQYDPCSKILKRELLWRWMKANTPGATVYVGLDWTEDHRLERLRQRQPEWKIESPMMWKPLRDKQDMLKDLMKLGIKPPRLYGMGFAHNNCSGFCVPMTCEALTPSGWKPRSKLKIGDEIMAYAPDIDELVFEPIQDLTDMTDEVLRFGNKKWQFESTKRHGWFAEVRARQGKGERVWKPEYLTTAQLGRTSARRIVTSAPHWGGGLALTEDEAALIAWLMTDGSLNWDITTAGGKPSRRVKATIWQTKPEGLVELQRRFSDWITSDSERKSGGHALNIKADIVRSIWSKADLSPGSEDWVKLVVALSPLARQAFLDAAWRAEGWLNGRFRNIAQNAGPKLEAIMTAGALCGYKVTSRRHILSVNSLYANSTTCRVVHLSDKRSVTASHFRYESRGVQQVWCPTVRTGFWLAKLGNVITITGNCIKSGQAQFRLLLETRPELYAWHEQKEQELREYLGKDVAILRDRRGGTTKPMTLKAFRERIQGGDCHDRHDWGGCGCAID